jgi:hypothetical protein
MSFAEGTQTATITLNGQRHTLGFTLGAMRRIKERLGTLEMGESEEEQIQAIPAYVWSCMTAADRESLSVEDIEESIHPHNLTAISDAIAALFEASQPEGEAGKADPVPPKVRRAARRK